MTTISKQAHENGGSSHTAQVNYSLGTAPALSCITKVEISGQLSFDGGGGITDTNSSFWQAYYTHGIQYGATGYTPADITAFAAFDSGNWFFGATPIPSNAVAVWAPSSDAAGVNDRWSFRLTVWPYFISGASATDIYYSVGPTITSPGQGFRLFASLRVWYE